MVIPPIVERLPTKTAWTNFGDICSGIKRESDHLKKYLGQELGTDTYITQEGKFLMMKGRYQQPQIQNILKKYLTLFVICENCRRMDTELVKDPSTRTYILKCNKCGASKTADKIRDGFKALKKGQRRREKAV